MLEERELRIITERRSRNRTGPNGSGKSTIKSYVGRYIPEELFGHYINISRVENRVRAGGHDVPTDKITARYHRPLGLLWEAVEHADRAYIFDNSSAEADWVAEITDAERLEIKTDNVPAWFSRLITGKCGGGV